MEWGRELLIEGGNAQGLTFSALRNYRWKYVEHTDGEVELYDLQSDPDELMSLHAGPETAALRARFAARLAVLRTCAGRTCRLRPALRLHVRRQQCRFVTQCAARTRARSRWSGSPCGAARSRATRGRRSAAA